jgi:pimeloyl-ACP methyl ester carboxylesterase
MFRNVLMISALLIMFIVVVISGTGVSYAEESKKVFDAHDVGVKYHFNDTDMDFNFGTLVLGSTVNHGCEIGEAFYTASKIKDGDAASWQNEWFKLACLTETRGLKSLANGHKVSARDQLSRAAYYYRFSLLAMLPDDTRMKDRALKSREVMKKAGQLYDPPIEYFEIPYEGTVLPVYFRKAHNDNKPAKTLLMIGGGETFAEDLIFYIAPQAFDRGYNFMTCDLPGQGLLPLYGKPFRPDMNVPMKAVVDYALSRKDVDPEKFASYGYSGGGGFVPQAAMFDSRIRAIAMSSAVVDAYPLFSTMPVVIADQKTIDSWSSFHGNIVKAICWRWGVPMDKPSGLAEANKGYTFDPARITVPALLIVGEGEFKSEEVKRQQQVCMDNFPNPLKKLVITPASEGANNHCVMENRSLMSQVLFDWLDEVLK